ncbi:Secretion protein HlyD [Trichormus variabilis ATCC 29413]|uniref:Secretion protein HlyD n=2 Tax=Anabaena variabilis TaxID=264691 RepID=Q3M6E2_TRIV2|nr:MULTISPECIES: efflux RND transporter periplasmic adaptor subunit [Nostocaceae]ABA23444.1 Secretion protein HlyD [Trichormus variabilis ATCC 29413]MBC1216573.1 efflux RND transporter periplasmic adaptor subunit [Trichormus variabilis ARAD]MBC1258471.1 efflux RND transporter periplasmic adaptor subunit [Trichormus variabilis V5]MBC1270431.1 efflux RND transporter periplasmic adaptor subunit [Trichormus variabilis FSR]MBC1302749.1 efflux RND transporter periplasmic adaptor subunit [Trichormus 
MSSSEPQTDFRDNLPQEPPEPPPKQRRWLRLLLAAILLLGGGTAIVWRLLTPSDRPPATAEAQPPGVRVKTSPVQVGTIEESTDFVASLESRRSVTLQPRVQGQVTQIFVRSGDAIASGAAVIQIDPRQQQAAVISNDAATQASKAQLENANATLKSLEAERLSNVADVRLNQQEYDRYTTLADQGAVSRQTKDQYANRLATARANLNAIESRIQAQKASVAQAQKSVQQAQANTDEQQVQLQFYRITAPFEGTVGNIPIKIGDFVNSSTPLLTITQNRPLEVNISVPLERGSQLRQGMPVEIMNTQGQTLGTSRVFFIAPNASNETQSILVKALYNNTNGQLRADQLVRARVIWNQRTGVLIPITAVTRIAGETFVYVTQTEKTPQGTSQLVARQKRVQLGDIRGNNYQIIKGLQPTDTIVTSGLLNLRDGVPIVPES